MSVEERTLIPLHRLQPAEFGPPRLTALPNGTPAWLVTRYHDVRHVLTDPRFGRATLYAPDAPPLGASSNLEGDPGFITNIDGADHRQLRALMQQAFTRRAIAAWVPWLTSVVERLVGDVAEHGPPADLVASLTLPLPVEVISRLMGVEDVDRKRLRHWTDHLFADRNCPLDEVRAVLAEFATFAAELLDERRRRPGDDLVSRVVVAADRQGGISEERLIKLVCGLIAGGHETTVATLGNALVYLLGERPDAWSRLTSEDAAQAAADRLLHNIPLGEGQGALRRSVREAVVGGVAIPAGAVVIVDRTSAARDPEVFTTGLSDGLFEPLEATTLAFGAGPHYCLGAWLARIELRQALHRLATLLPGLRLAEPVDAIEWRCVSTTRSPRRLTVTW
ncbi:cytochrome P450 [Streptomyces kaniharaensis]|uniref:Cytochrome P450 n=1 Tax=Streptomyces kaniharaensis TaxID=212423 RepID=A0A6N7KHW9_9ACTN|nr:cytochrome P450 [Streptomyces kaniharaensis]MQS11080.1 cytochrome P450 [Streptomyces kaniharaensis]